MINLHFNFTAPFVNGIRSRWAGSGLGLERVNLGRNLGLVRVLCVLRVCFVCALESRSLGRLFGPLCFKQPADWLGLRAARTASECA